MERERERAVRFSNLEIEVLVDLVKTHIIVEEKRLDCTTNAVKRQAWENITSEFWSRTSSNRTEFQLLKKWKNLKHAARKYEAAINNKEQCVPGRGPPPRSPILEEVLDVIKREQEALRNSKVNNVNMCLPTRIKVEEEDYGSNIEPIDSRICSDGSTNWEQEEYIPSPEDVSVSNGVILHQMEVLPEEEEMPVDPNPFSTIRTRRRSGNTLKRNPEVVECVGDSSEDAISVGGCSVSSRRSHAMGKLLPSGIQQQTDRVNCGEESSKLAHLVHEKELALKSAQLALLEKENKIKDLDIRIREEQLTDIIIRRKHEQELHELRKRRMLQGLNDR